jgi:hypothetical protein
MEESKTINFFSLSDYFLSKVRDQKLDDGLGFPGPGAGH